MPDDDPRLAPPVPVTILTGFLGAGKTTLMNYLLGELSSKEGARVAVLVNDFGDINIDAEVVDGKAGEVLNLGGGCICCSIQGHLTSAVMALLSRDEPPKHILIEASGVSEPMAIAMTFMAPGLRRSVRLDAILAVVDTEVAPYPSAPRQQELIEAQMRAANMVILNKVDRASAEQVAEVRDWVRDLTPKARLLEAAHARVPVPLVMGTGIDWLEHFEDDVETHEEDVHQHDHHHEADGHEAHDHEGHHHHHDDDHSTHDDTFETWSYSSDVPFATLPGVKQVLKELPPDGLFRAKGLVAAEETERRVIMQMAGRRVAFTYEQPWGEDEVRRTRLVFIGRPGALSSERIRSALDERLAGATAFT